MLPPNCLRTKIMIRKCFMAHHFWVDICSRSKSVSRKQPSAMYMRVEDSMARLKCRVPRSRYRSRQSRAADLFGCVHTVVSTPLASLPQQVERDSVCVSVNEDDAALRLTCERDQQLEGIVDLAIETFCFEASRASIYSNTFLKSSSVIRRYPISFSSTPHPSSLEVTDCDFKIPPSFLAI